MAHELDPANIHTSASLIEIAKTRLSTASQAMPIFKAATKQEPDNFILQKQMLEVLKPKWGGTVSAMFEFAKNQAGTSSPDSKSPLLIPMAHWEVVQSYYSQAPKDYFSKVPIWEDCKTAFEELIKRFPKSVEIRTMYLRTAYYAGDLTTARVQYEMIKDKIRVKEWRDATEVLEIKRALLAKS